MFKYCQESKTAKRNTILKRNNFQKAAMINFIPTNPEYTHFYLLMKNLPQRSAVSVFNETNIVISHNLKNHIVSKILTWKGCIISFSACRPGLRQGVSDTHTSK